MSPGVHVAALLKRAEEQTATRKKKRPWRSPFSSLFCAPPSGPSARRAAAKPSGLAPGCSACTECMGTSGAAAHTDLDRGPRLTRAPPSPPPLPRPETADSVSLRHPPRCRPLPTFRLSTWARPAPRRARPSRRCGENENGGGLTPLSGPGAMAGAQRAHCARVGPLSSPFPHAGGPPPARRANQGRHRPPHCACSQG